MWHLTPPPPPEVFRLQLLGLGVTLTLSERWRKSSAGDGVGETKHREHFREQKDTLTFSRFQGWLRTESLRVTRAGGRTPPSTRFPTFSEHASLSPGDPASQARAKSGCAVPAGSRGSGVDSRGGMVGCGLHTPWCCAA